ncbi:MAG: SPFH domain-containing protein [Chitinophagaceae bacterium]|jgi:regulator of protease activity HflC (stomatin/prohibitin superfamily)|nr:SPFH domain-containing protein [Chitinophagaceae bacterium]MBP6045718.1 SPFH domain-containing protein [Ferruginibacter sp.]MBK7088058.1 SPFH domain-containing protein [Chitinophagaceae bacterium]MBK7346805.1 SPFH domain-containing protein [Chitinophagaceae bacterium]MBK7735277.1 SPFH domain-containing protein [Chitinophagaceae bacterium]
MEKILKPISGFLALLVSLVLIVLSILLFLNGKSEPLMVASGFIVFFTALFIIKGLMIINPNHSRVLNFFGKYVGTVKNNGLFFVNPFYATIKVSLRAQNLQGQSLKVNDKMGNPIEIGAVIVWKVGDTYKAVYEVDDYKDYVSKQSEAAVRHLAVSFAYDNLEDEKAEITLRDGGDKVNQILEKELTERLSPAGIIIQEARISHLAYAQEIAGAMLQRQQATAIVAARFKIVEGAVGMVDLALKKLSQENIVDLDDERKAAMVSNLMVVLCGEKAATPILNTGTLYQ